MSQRPASGQGPSALALIDSRLKKGEGHGCIKKPHCDGTVGIMVGYADSKLSTPNFVFNSDRMLGIQPITLKVKDGSTKKPSNAIRSLNIYHSQSTQKPAKVLWPSKLRVINAKRPPPKAGGGLFLA